MNAALLTELGEALGCSTPRATRSLRGAPARRPSDPERSTTAERAGRAPRLQDREPSLPDRCYFSGDLAELGPAPPPHVRVALGWGYMDREASELAQRSRADLIQFFQMKARIARRGRKPQQLRSMTAGGGLS